MTTPSNSPAPHAGESEAPAIPKEGETPGMGAPPSDAGGTQREQGIFPKPPNKDGTIPELDEPDVEGVGEEGRSRTPAQ